MRGTFVLEIVIKAMPKLAPETSLKAIARFRKYPNTQAKKFALRRWMQEVASTEESPKHVADELEWLLHEYEQHMRLHRMKVEYGLLETIVTTGAMCLRTW